MAGNLTHDNILSIYDFGEDDQKRPFMVMEFLRGEDLRSALRKGHTGDVAAKLKVALQVAKGARVYALAEDRPPRYQAGEYSYQCCGRGEADRFRHRQDRGSADDARGVCARHRPFYMAPEQVMGHAITEQVDVYAFGVLLFELFTGVKPIQAETGGTDFLLHLE